MASLDLRSRDVRGWIYYDIGNPDEIAAAESWIGRIATQPLPATQGYVKTSFIGAHPGIRPLRMPRKTTDAITGNFQVDCSVYESNLRVELSQMTQDQQGLLRAWVTAGMTRPVQRRWAKIVTAAIEAGTTIKSPDGVTFFGTTHTFGRNTTQQLNTRTKSGIGASLIPTTAQVQDMVWEAVVDMTTLKDNESEPLNSGSGFVVMFHPKIQRAVKEAFRSALVDTGTVLKLNTLDQSVSDFGFTLVMNRYLSTHAAIYLFADDSMSMVRAQEYDVILESIAEGTEFAIRNLAHEHFLRFSIGAKLYRWESAYRYLMAA